MGFSKQEQAGRALKRARRFGWNSTMAAPDAPMSKTSAKRAGEIAEESPVRRAWVRAHPRCETKAIGGFAVSPCMGDLHVHEIWPRGQGGPTDDPRNFSTQCDYHNGALQQSDLRDFGLANGLLVRAAEGPRWLAAGGRFPGMSRDDALAQLPIDVKDLR